jgi:hypothetical protein
MDRRAAKKAGLTTLLVLGLLGALFVFGLGFIWLCERYPAAGWVLYAAGLIGTIYGLFYWVFKELDVL